MTQNHRLQPNTKHTLSLKKCALTGAGIALTLISIFLIGAGDPNPAWPDYWYIKPLIMVPLAGATGGAVFYFLNYLSNHHGFNKTVAILLGFIIYIIGLWMGTVLGLNGTMWN